MTAPASDALQPDVQCPCGHGPDEHDALASRYCQATIEGALDRNCMCARESSPLRVNGTRY